MNDMFFDDWSGVGRTVVVGVCAYVGLVLILRISGKRTLSKMNAFDFVVTVALGSSLATILLSKDTALVEGLTALIVLVALQAIVAFASERSGMIEGIVKSEPVLLMHRGTLLKQALRKERVTETEIWAAVRSQGIARSEEVEAVILETDGSFSVLRAGENPAGPDTLKGVQNA